MTGSRARPADRWRGAVGVFGVFLRLGVTSFGGPIAHLGYFRDEFVVRRRWLTETDYADVVGLCQILPGPASSQVGMAIGLRRAGFAGLLAAWCGFTLPSAVLMTAFAFLVVGVGDVSSTGWVNGLKAVAVAVVAQAVLGMAHALAADRIRALLAVVVAALVLLVPGTLVPLGALALAALLGVMLLRQERASIDSGAAAAIARVPRAVAITATAVYAGLLLLLPLVAAWTDNRAMRLFAGFYQSGALVFGGGHVVLPLLEAQTVGTGLVGHSVFLAGYGAAQAVPGPLFTVAAYLGAVSEGTPSSVPGAAIALAGIFLPGALLVVGALPAWQVLRRVPWARRALAGVNAGVVGLLAAALYHPLFADGITSSTAFVLALAAFVALTRFRVPPWAVVITAALLGDLALG